MKIDDIKIKIPNNYMIDSYAEFNVKESYTGFLNDYARLIDEKDFKTVLVHHDTKLKANEFERIDSIFSFKKQYTQEHICEQILLMDIDKKDTLNYIKYQLYAFKLTYKHILSEIINLLDKHHNGLFTHRVFNAKISLLYKNLLDMQELLPLAEKLSGDEPKSSLSMSRKVDGYEVFSFTNHYANGIIDFSNRTYYTTYAFLLRQSIEIRVKSGLGIIAIIKNNKQLKITSDIFIDFIYENDKIKIPKINKSILKKAFYWSNYHIHNSIALYYWQFFLLNNYLTPFFKFSSDGGSNIHISGAISMTRDYYENTLSEDILAYLEKRNINADEIAIAQHPEALLT